jgi:tRNA(fMet)-specific endonuclease VapC
MILLDTNICIYIIKQKPPLVLQRFQAIPLGEVGVSAITVAELEYGVAKSQRPLQNQQALTQFLLPLTVLPFMAEDGAVYGRIRAQLESAGTPIGALDLLIAAQALAHNIPLVTNNEAEFLRVPGLRVENWARPAV